MSVLSPLALAVLPACGDGPAEEHHQEGEGTCAGEVAAEPYAAGLVKVGAAGVFTVELASSLPAPPAKGDNRWTLKVRDDHGSPVEGATVSVVPYMPAHGHGAATDPVVTPSGAPGEYLADPVNLSMPGVWEITVTVAGDGGTDTAGFVFCVEG